MRRRPERNAAWTPPFRLSGNPIPEISKTQIWDQMSRRHFPISSLFVQNGYEWVSMAAIELVECFCKSLWPF
jgi:hypothetical protein